jgi:hypothetical protein
MTPLEEYTDRLAAREAAVRQSEMAQRRVSSVRLVLAAIALGLAWASFGEGWLSGLWMLAPVAVFAGAVFHHGILRRRHARAVRAVHFYQRGLGRLEDRWAGMGNRGERFADIHHVYAGDLDVFGDGSLFELLCAARTRMGEEMLARWLLAPAPLGEIRQRQGGVRELRERQDLRERIGLLGSEREPALRPDSFLAWAEAPERLPKAWLGFAAYFLPALLLVASIAGALTGIWSPVLLVLIVEAMVLYRLRESLEAVLFPPESAFDFEGLKILEGLLLEIEREAFDSAPLRSLVEALGPGDGTASGRIRRLATLVRFSEQRLNPIVRAVQVPVLYLLQLGLAMERWRRAYGRSVRDWVEAAGRFEALSSLAQYSFEHPDDPFPEFHEGHAQLRAQGIGHPLIPRAQCVRNDVALSNRPRIWLISGSNMSGKSTLLRAVGLNVVLAMAGGPVRAQALELTPLQVGASIRVNDSLREGSSRFYAEITRLRQLKELLGCEPPLLFLIDEMLQGTNSNDRRIGAEGILRALADEGAIGLATTHDLALTDLSGLGAGILQNMHFEDHLENGRMHFDYRLRPGVVTKSNGLELMRAIGLRV